MTVFLTIIAVGFIIFVHECGHLIFAKLGGIGVTEFSVGMGPRLAGFSYKDTLYSLRLFPLGGYVKLAGLDDTDVDLDPDTFYQNRPLFSRFLTISAGSVMNLILGFVTFFILLFFLGLPTISNTIKTVLPDGPAHLSGIVAEDVLVSVNGSPIKDVRRDFIQVVNQTSQPMELTLKKGEELHIVTVTPYFDSENKVNRIGIELDMEVQKRSFFGAIQDANAMTLKTMQMVVVSFKMLFSGQATLKDMSGPIGIVQIASFQLSQSVRHFLNIMALISITLGVLNLLPIPVLDGGHLFFLAYEAIFKKPAPKKVEAMLTNIFASFLILLMVLVIFNDVRFWADRTDLLRTLTE